MLIFFFIQNSVNIPCTASVCQALFHTLGKTVKGMENKPHIAERGSNGETQTVSVYKEHVVLSGRSEVK